LALAHRGASAVGLGEAGVRRAARALFRDARRDNASEGAHQAHPLRDGRTEHRQERRNGRRCQGHRERTGGSGCQVLRDRTDASAGGRLRGREQPLQAEQQTAPQVGAQRTAEQAMALPERRLQATRALPEARWG